SHGRGATASRRRHSAAGRPGVLRGPPGKGRPARQSKALAGPGRRLGRDQHGSVQRGGGAALRCARSLPNTRAKCTLSRGRIIDKAKAFSAADAFAGRYRLEALRAAIRPLWRGIDVLGVPTAPCAPTLQEIETDPLGPNAKLGTYTNFVNLLELAAIAVP